MVGLTVNKETTKRNRTRSDAKKDMGNCCKKKENEGAIKDSELSKIPYLCSQIKLLIYVVAKNCKKKM